LVTEAPPSSAEEPKMTSREVKLLGLTTIEDGGSAYDLGVSEAGSDMVAEAL